MAWRSSGSTNDEMVNNLKRFGVISSPTLERGFRNVDRKYFVPRIRENVAHIDQPLKEGNIHISAPHIYGSALEALDLVPNSSLSFLNVGSGTGYVSCIVADILGIRSSNYGIEIYEDVVKHSQASIKRWKRARQEDGVAKVPRIDIIHGNALHVSQTSGESLVGFDRIYVGAAVESRHLSNLTRMLRPGGILVGPVDDELVKVVRIGSKRRTNDDMDTVADQEDCVQQVLAAVRFAPLLYFPKMTTVIPSRVWEPASHQYYPDSFRVACKELLLCSHADPVQPHPPTYIPDGRINLAATLPKVLWLEILSFIHRDWFEPPQSEEGFLRRRLLEEQANSQKAHEARLEAEAKCEIAERERDIYRLLARRWRTRLQVLLQQRQHSTGTSYTFNDDDVILLSGRDHPVLFGLGSMLHSVTSQEENDASEEHDMTMGEDGTLGMDMDNDLEDAQDDDDDDDDDDFHELHEESEDEDVGNYDISIDDTDGDQIGQNLRDDTTMAVSPGTERAIVARPQFRTVSITSDDL